MLCRQPVGDRQKHTVDARQLRGNNRALRIRIRQPLGKLRKTIAAKVIDRTAHIFTRRAMSAKNLLRVAPRSRTAMAMRLSTLNELHFPILLASARKLSPFDFPLHSAKSGAINHEVIHAPEKLAQSDQGTGSAICVQRSQPRFCMISMLISAHIDEHRSRAE